MILTKIIIVFDRQLSRLGGKKAEMNPIIYIEKHQDDDFPVVVEPWIVEQRADHNCVGPASKKEPGKVREHIFSTERNRHNPSGTAQNDFHARLVAAAPELYVAVKEVLQYIEMSQSEFPIDTTDLLRLAANKVEGNQ